MAVQESFLSRVSDAVRSGTVGQEIKRSAQWFQDKIKGLKGNLRNRFSSTNAAKFYRESETKVQPAVLKRRVELGDLFCYYYNPKYRKTLPYYDMFPMIMLLSAEQEIAIFLPTERFKKAGKANVWSDSERKFG